MSKIKAFFVNNKKNIIIGSKLLLIGALAGLALSFTNEITAPIIQRNLDKKTMELYESIYPEIARFEKLSGFTATSTVTDAVEVFDADGNSLGRIYHAQGRNSHGDMSIIVGIYNNRVVSVEFLTYNQTPGIGDLALSGAPSRYDNLQIGQVASVDPVAGATNSSNTIKELVTAIVNIHNALGGV